MISFDTDTFSGKRFESVTELQQAHEKLLELIDKELEEDNSIESEVEAIKRYQAEICEFLKCGSATGIYIENVKNRTACQVLLDYWVANLSQAGIPSLGIRLAKFDEKQLPSLEGVPCPYAGLESFNDSTSTLFFGRESDTQKLLAQVRDTPLVIVFGASGSGKSSLVLAGVLPRIPKEIPNLQVVRPFVPGNAVLDHLADAILSTQKVEDRHIKAEVAQLRQDSQHLGEMLGGDNAPPTLITIDQFEEVFTLSDSADREALTANLSQFLKASKEHRVILTMREEFRDKIAQLKELNEYLEQDQALYQIFPMLSRQLKAAIEEPAAKVNLQFQPGIVDDLVQRVVGQPAALPLLQFTLERLWKEKKRNRITKEVYDKVGDPLEALQHFADQFYKARLPEDRGEIERILLELVRTDVLLEEGYRQPVLKSHLLEAGKANTEKVLELLLKNGFIRITPDVANSDAIVEVKHEALIRNWERYGKWITKKRRGEKEELEKEVFIKKVEEDSSIALKDFDTGWEARALLKALKAVQELQNYAGDINIKSKEYPTLQPIHTLQKILDTICEQNEVKTGALIPRCFDFSANLQKFVIPDIDSKEIQLWNASGESHITLDKDKFSNLCTAVKFSPDDKIIVIATAESIEVDAENRRWNSQVWLCDQNGEILIELKEQEGYISNIIFTPDGQQFVTTVEGKLRFYSLSGELLNELEIETPERWITKISFSSDENQFITLSRCFKDWKRCEVKVWQLDDQFKVQLISRLEVTDESELNSFDLILNEQLIVTGSDIGMVEFWDLSGKPSDIHRPFRAAFESITDLTVNPNKKQLAVIEGETPSIKVFDFNGKLLKELKGHWVGASGIKFSKNGNFLATVGNDGYVRFWDLSPKQSMSSMLASSEHKTRTVARFNPHYEQEVLSFSNEGNIVIEDLTRKRCYSIFRQSDKVLTAKFSSNGQQIIQVNKDGEIIVYGKSPEADGSTRFVEKCKNPPRQGDTLLSDSVRVTSVSPNGQLIAQSGDAYWIELWDLYGKRKAKWNHNAWVWDLCFINDESFATAGWDSKVKIWKIPQEKPDISTDDAYAGVSPTQVGTPQNASDKQTEKTPQNDFEPIFEILISEGPLLAVSYNPVKRWIATAGVDGIIHIYDFDGKKLAVWQGHTSWIWDLSFSNDGDRLSTAGSDGTARFWDISDIEHHVQLAELYLGQVQILSVSFSPKGEKLVLGVSNGDVILWEPQDLDLDNLVKQAQNWILNYCAALKDENARQVRRLVSDAKQLISSNRQQAIEKFATAIELDSNCEDALIERSEIYIRDENYEKALSDLSKAITLNASFEGLTISSSSDKLELNKMADLYTRMGVAYSSINNSEKAKESFYNAIKLYQRQGIPSPGEKLGQKICSEYIPSISQYWRLNTIFTELISSSDDKVDLLKNFADAQQNLANYLSKLYKLHLADSKTQFPITTPIVVEVGDAIVPIVDDKQDNGHFIYELIPQMRDRIKTDFGINIPGIRLRANPALAPEAYLFMIDEVPTARGNVHVGMYFFEGTIDVLNEIGVADQSIPDIHPLTHRTGYWVPESAQTALQAAEHELIPAPTHLIHQFEALIRRNLVRFFGIEDAETLLQSWESSETAKSLVAALHLTSRDRLRLIQVLRELIRDHVPLTQGETILNALQGVNLASDDIHHLTRLVRLQLRQQLPDNTPGTIRVPIPLAEEQTLFTITGDRASFIASPQQKHEFLVWLRDQLQELQADPFNTVLVTPNPEPRPLLRRLIEPEFPEPMVLSQEEVLEFPEVTSSSSSDESPTTNLSESPPLTATPTPDDESEEVTK